MYEITQDYIKKGNARCGQSLVGGKPKFIVAHDTGNPGSTAKNNRDYFNNHQPSASAHTFIDDRYILEIIPLTEKAWHVLYGKPTDNKMFGDDANDAAIGVELCWGNGIDFNEAYKRYVWYHAYLCKKFGLNPEKHIVSHKTLDPERKTDPDNALNRHGITWAKFLADVREVFEPVLNGWKKYSGVWYYYKDGKKHVGWLQYKNKWYYLEPSQGKMVTGLQTISGKKYYFLPDGDMILTNKDGVIQ